MISALDEATAERGLAAGTLRCGCGGRLRGWGRTRPRAVRGRDGRWSRVRLRRTRCAGCRRTHVVVPAAYLRRRVDHTDTVGAALLAAAQGAGHRRVAADLDRPVDTVRGRLRRFRDQSELLRGVATRLAVSLDPRFEPERPQPTPLADAVTALGAAAASVVRRLGGAVVARLADHCHDHRRQAALAGSRKLIK